VGEQVALVLCPWLGEVLFVTQCRDAAPAGYASGADCLHLWKVVQQLSTQLLLHRRHHRHHHQHHHHRRDKQQTLFLAKKLGTRE
jgi:hypothetical protein